jgi:hypothetical protein
MQLQDLIEQLRQELAAAEADVAAKERALRQAEIRAAFLQGQIHGLSQIRIEERPIYSSGEEDGSASA